MSVVKRISGDYTLINRDPYLGAANVTITTHTMFIDGNLLVGGNSSVITRSNLNISDNTIILNSGETGAGVTMGTAGIEIARGSLANVDLRWNESNKYWELTNDGTTYQELMATLKTLIYTTLL